MAQNLGARHFKLEIPKAQRYIDELINSQIDNDDREYAAKSLCNLAKFSQDVFQFSFSLQLTSRAVEISPEDTWSWCQHAEALMHVRRYEEANDAIAKARTGGEEVFAASAEARILRHTGQFEEAVEKYKSILKDFADSEDAWNSFYSLADLYRTLGEFEKSQNTFDIGKQKFPYVPLLHCGAGTFYRETGKMDQAIRSFSDSMKVAKPTVEGFVGLGDTYLELENFKQALGNYHSAKKISAIDPIPYSRIAELERKTGNHNSALKIYKDMQQRFVFDFHGWYGEAEVLRETGKYASSIQTLDFAIEKFSGDPQPFLRCRRANIFKSWGKYEEALKEFGTVTARYSDNIYAEFSRAELLKELGRNDLALRRLEYLLDGRRKLDAEISINAILVASGRYDLVLEKLPDQKPRTKRDWISRHIRGMALLKSGKLDDALSLFSQGHKEVPFASERKYYATALALTQLRQQKFEAARDTVTDIDSPISNVIKLHVGSILKDYASAEMAYTALKNSCPPTVVAIRDELAAHLGLSDRQPRHDKDWIFNEECSTMTIAATQQETA